MYVFFTPFYAVIYKHSGFPKKKKGEKRKRKKEREKQRKGGREKEIREEKKRSPQYFYELLKCIRAHTL